jgi:hypothetical protein
VPASAPINPRHLTARQNGIPTQATGTIAAMTKEAVDGTTAGADGLPHNPATLPGAQSHNIPAVARDAIVPPTGWHVP